MHDKVSLELAALSCLPSLLLSWIDILIRVTRIGIVLKSLIVIVESDVFLATWLLELNAC